MFDRPIHPAAPRSERPETADGLSRQIPFGLGALVRSSLSPVFWDLVAAVLVTAVLAGLGLAAAGTFAPLSRLTTEPISLDPGRLPYYALRTLLRMLAAMAASLAFTLVYGTLAAKSRRAETILIPLLDILQSVPVLGYISFSVVFFLDLFPGRVLGAELAAVFAIFTSQAWNMTFSFYQSLRTLPQDLEEACQAFRLSAWQHFWRLDVPFAVPGLVWNMMMSMSGGWFFVVASEAISVGDYQIMLPGIGSFVATAVIHENGRAIGQAVLAMGLVIVIYDQLLFRPLAVWADGFRVEQTAGVVPHSWFLQLIRRSRLVRAFSHPGRAGGRRLLRASLLNPQFSASRASARAWPANLIWFAAMGCILIWSAEEVSGFLVGRLGWEDVAMVLRLGGLSLARVLILISLASVIWVPLGVLTGLRPRLAAFVQPIAQFLAAFPVNLLFPVAVFLILRWQLDPDIWLSPLMILGTQWYILFNVIAGAAAYPTDLLEAAAEFHFRGFQWWWRAILPGIFPYFVTGAIIASGAWNASIVAEAVSWGNTHLYARGLGAYIARNTASGDYPRIVLGIAVMSMFVIAINRLLWRPLYAYAERRSRLS